MQENEKKIENDKRKAMRRKVQNKKQCEERCEEERDTKKWNTNTKKYKRIMKKQCEERCKEERGIEQRVTIRPDQYWWVCPTVIHLHENQ